MSSEQHITDHYFQDWADAKRALKLGLLEHDPEVVQIGMEKLSKLVGEEMAGRVTLQFITRLMDTEGFSFFNEETGEPSPLLGNIYEDNAVQG